MELTGLKSFKNAGGSVYSSIGSSGISKTVEYKLINNLPKYADGIITLNSTPGLQNSFLAPVIERTITPNNINMSDSSNLSAIQKANIRAGGTGEYNNYTKSVIGSNTGSLTNSNGGGGKTVGPASTGGKGVDLSGIGNVVTTGTLFAGDAINSFSINESAEEIAARQGTSGMSIGGVTYNSPNTINISDEIDRVKKENIGNTMKTVGSGTALGAAVGSVIPGLGTALGAGIGAAVGLFTGIFGGASRKRKYREMLAKQNAKINALQDSSRFSAQTKAIQQMNAREYGDSEAQYLYGAAEGKLPEVDPKTMLSKDKLLSITPNGYTIDNADSMVEPGETLFNTETGSMMQVPRLANGKLHPGDIQPAKIGNAAVFTDRHKDPITGKSFALAAIDGDDDPYNLLYRQKVLVNDKKNNKGLMKVKNGKLPRFDDGFVSPWKMMLENVKKSSQNNINRWKNTIALPEQLGFGGYADPYSINPNLNPPSSEYNNYTNEGSTGKWFTSALDNLPYYFNMASALGHSLFRDRRIFTPKTGIAAPQGLERLDALRMNPYPIFLNNRNIEARSKKAIDMSGGLTSAQKTLAYLASQYNTQLNNARALANMQIQDNQYISDAVKTRLAAESAYDQRVVAQNNLRDDILMRGHAANQQTDMDDLTTLTTAWQQANKNRFNGNVYRWMMDQYALENKANRKKKLIS